MYKSCCVFVGCESPQQDTQEQQFEEPQPTGQQNENPSAQHTQGQSNEEPPSTSKQTKEKEKRGIDAIEGMEGMDIYLYMPGLNDGTLKKQVEAIQTYYETQKEQLKAWTSYDNCAKAITKCFMALFMISTSVVSLIAGITASPLLSYIAAVIAALGVLKGQLKKLLITNFTTKRRKMYMKKRFIIRRYLAKLYKFYLENRKKMSDVKTKAVTKVQFQEIITELYDTLIKIEYDILDETAELSPEAWRSSPDQESEERLPTAQTGQGQQNKELPAQHDDSQGQSNEE